MIRLKQNRNCYFILLLHGFFVAAVFLPVLLAVLVLSGECGSECTWSFFLFALIQIHSIPTIISQNDMYA